MTTKLEIQKLLAEALQKCFAVTKQPDQVHLERPADYSHGDWASNIPMVLAKELKQNPKQIAEKLVAEISADKGALFQSVEVAGPGFINFRVLDSVLVGELEEIARLKEKFGHQQINSGKVILVEHTSPNPNKEFHLGHLKNNVTGLAVSYLLEASGAKIFRDCINNNRGIAIVKLMWGYLRFGRKDEKVITDVHYWFEHQQEWHTPGSIGLKPDRFMDKMYTSGAHDFKNSPEVEGILRQMLLDWEAEEPHVWALWKLTQDWVWEGYERSIGRVDGFKFDRIWNEHEIYKKGKEHVLAGLEKGVFKKTEDGAIVSDLKEFNLSDTILVRGDGTSLYITQDIELTNLKRETFHPDQMFWVIGPEQSLAMKQMFAVCSLLGFGRYEDFHHIPYGFVSIRNAEGKVAKMSSRDGTAIYVDDLIDLAKEKVLNYIDESIVGEERDQIAEQVAIGAIKYSLLKVSRTTDQVFDIDTTLSLEGDSGPYILYSYARAQAILKKSNLQEYSVDTDWEISEIERELMHKLSTFPEVVSLAIEIYAPNIVAGYVYELAQIFNNFYTHTIILKAESEKLKLNRLMLVKGFQQVMHNALGILGIEPLDKM